ncbi:MAG TPA: sn-glycerol-3-phosphate ABC transporter ATP-binding protein UgpC [Acidimicrobiia bacterium]|nr:sn-glycerol-3-phosphate ABC transporter ATP-binding protein UgpC [Acidimicrobiia bacterium]
MADVEFKDVEKQYPNGFQAVTDLNLEIEEGEFLVMVGPSGCGKSTTLRMIAGLEDITGGELSIGGRVVNDVPPKDRDIAMVFQNYALYPHMTVAENIGFALKLAKTPKDEIKQRVDAAGRMLELTEILDRKPAQLSGGQRQRVAMGRAIVRRPRVFLLDEPLSNLDAKLRVQMRAQITELQREVGVTTFYVTHDQVEAMTMADRVAVINRGILQQVDSPQKLYDRPDNLFVAAFIGSPSMNLMEARLDEANGAVKIQVGSQSLAVPASAFERRPGLRDYVGRSVTVGIRPEDFGDAALQTDHPADQRLRAEANNVEALGFERIVYFNLDAVPVFSEDALDLDEDVEEVLPQDVTRVSSRFEPASRVAAGDSFEVTVDVVNAHYFDPESGLAIR